MVFRIEDCRIRYDSPDARWGHCNTHDRPSRECHDEDVNLEMVKSVLETFTQEFLLENKYKLTPAQRKSVEDAMALEFCELGWTDDHRLWCETHKSLAKHTMRNGDEPCCEVYAQSEGCCCCDQKVWER